MYKVHIDHLGLGLCAITRPTHEVRHISSMQFDFTPKVITTREKSMIAIINIKYLIHNNHNNSLITTSVRPRPPYYNNSMFNKTTSN